MSPGYFYMKAEENPIIAQLVRDVTGVDNVRWDHYESHPYVDHTADVTDYSEPGLEIDSIVRVITGPMRDKIGRVRKVDGDRVYLDLHMFQRLTRVTVHKSNLALESEE